MNGDRCLDFLRTRLRSGVSAPSVAKQFVHAVERDKGFLVDQGRVVAKIVSQLRKALPGVLLLDSECEKVLTKKLRKGASPEQAVTALLAEIKARPRKYLLLPAVGRPYDSCRRCRGCCP